MKKQKAQTKNKYAIYSLYLIVFSALLRFFLAAFHHPSGDSCWHLTMARYMADNFTIVGINNPWGMEGFAVPKMFHILLAAGYYFTSSDFLVKLISPAIATLFIIFSYLIAKKMFGEKIAFYSTIFVSFLPMSIYFGYLSYVDMPLALMTTIAFYFALEKRYYASAIFVALGALTKNNALFILLPIAYLTYADAKEKEKINFAKLLKIGIIFILAILIIAGPFYYRNYATLGNPVWPQLNSLFGLEAPSYNTIKMANSEGLLNIFHMHPYSKIYLEFFGVPNGDFSNLFFFQSKLLNGAVILWFIGTLIFFVPLVCFFFSDSLWKNKNIKEKMHINALLLIVLAFTLLSYIFIITVNDALGRFMLPLVPALGIFWGIGLNNILSIKNNHNKNLRGKKKKFNKAVILIIALLCAGFTASETIKMGMVAKEWNGFNQDFNWIKNNVLQDKTIYRSEALCLDYNLGRLGKRIDEKSFEDVGSYIFINEQTKLDSWGINQNYLNSNLKIIEIVYLNEKTGTKIIRINELNK